MKINQLIKHKKSSCLDLQFVVSKVATNAKDIQKTIIFVISIFKICPIISILQGQMKLLGYLEQLFKQIWPYYSTLSNWDKGFTTAAFAVAGNENEEYVILVATDAYSMGIDNPNVKLVIQWDILMSFDSIIQQIRRAARKSGQSTFIFFTPKWSEIKDPKEISSCEAKKTHS